MCAVPSPCRKTTVRLSQRVSQGGHVHACEHLCDGCKLDCNIPNMFPALPPCLCCFVPRKVWLLFLQRGNVQSSHISESTMKQFARPWLRCWALLGCWAQIWVLHQSLGTWRVCGIKFLNCQGDAAPGLLQ